MLIIRCAVLLTSFLLFSYLSISSTASVNEVKKRAEELLRFTSKAAEGLKQATRKRISDILLKSGQKSVAAGGKAVDIAQAAKNAAQKSSKMVKTLDSFGISRSLHSEIIGMSSSSVPRESIIAHIQVFVTFM
jgi:ElaB/YqjD/DUF883 family membrane-anchored ribosome-binding protein